MSGDILLKKRNTFILKPGTITSFPFKALSIPYFATYSLDNAFMLKCTFATLLKFVATGPGHYTLTFTFDFSLLNSSYILSVSLNT